MWCEVKPVWHFKLTWNCFLFIWETHCIFYFFTKTILIAYHFKIMIHACVDLKILLHVEFRLIDFHRKADHRLVNSHYHLDHYLLSFRLDLRAKYLITALPLTVCTTTRSFEVIIHKKCALALIFLLKGSKSWWIYQTRLTYI